MAIFYNERLLEHYHWPGHPESPERLKGIVRSLMNNGEWDMVETAPACTESDLMSVHTEDHLCHIREGKEFPLDQDTFLRADTYDIAKLAVGCALSAARRALDEGEPSLALVRPPGHHAGPGYCGAFCYFNNAAIAVQRSGAGRVAIIDLDAHHGNGTMDIFYEREDVLFISFHEYNLYPQEGRSDEVGRGAGEGYSVNVPFSLGAGDHTYFYGWNELMMPVVKQFDPDLVLVSLGIDAHYRDHESYLRVTTNGYLEILGRLMSIADGRLAMVLEGGYDVPSASDVLCGACARARGREYEPRFTENDEQVITGKAAVDATISIQRKYWEL